MNILKFKRSQQGHNKIKIILATQNKNKAIEFNKIFSSLDITYPYLISQKNHQMKPVRVSKRTHL